MMPVTPTSNRRPGVKPSIGSKLGSSSFPLTAPPLYYNSPEANPRRRLVGGIPKEARVLLVTDKDGNRINLPPKSPASFTPIKPKDEQQSSSSLPPSAFYMNSSTMTSSTMTPPASPYHPHAKQTMSLTSPSPTVTTTVSLLSESTNDYSMVSPLQYCISPSPSTPSATPSTPAYRRYSATDSSYTVRSSQPPPSPQQLLSSPHRGSFSSSSLRSPGGYMDPNLSRNGYMCSPTTTPSSSTSSPSSGSRVLQRGSPIKKMPSLLGSPGGGASVQSAASEDTANRKQRIKTELCTHYKRGNVCPFGSRCTYAHGEDELQMTKLMDWHRAGLIEDIETFRTKPCLTWVATGSCPFGVRCTCIHDKRVAGIHPSWLPHTETQGNSISTDINVDGMHQKRMHAILYDNPFGDQFAFELDDWADLYKLVCNVTSNIRRRRSSHLTELQKLSIVLQMRGNPGWMYKYRPQHIIYDTLCMVMQKQAFKVEKSGNAIPIQLSRFNPKNSKHVLVREIAFGPDSDPACRPVSLWFNIPEDCVTECTAQQAKRFRWKKKPKGDHSQQHAHSMGSMFESQDNFVMIRPEDRDAFDLATKILKHRYATLKADGLSNMRDRSAALKEADQYKLELQEEFNCHRRHWLEWAWPINNGRRLIVNEDTPVPPVNADYVPIIDNGRDDDDNYDDDSLMGGDPTNSKADEAVQGQYVQRIWKSFVSMRLTDTATSTSSSPAWRKKKHQQQAISTRSSVGGKNYRRLSVFARLGYGEPISKDRSLPHINCTVSIALKSDVNNVLSTSTSSTKSINSDRNLSLKNDVPCQSERCWKALMLELDTGLHKANEWQIVLEHFQNARSKNSITKVQQ